MLSHYILKLARSLLRGNEPCGASLVDLNSKHSPPHKARANRPAGVSWAILSAAAFLGLTNSASAEDHHLDRAFNKPGNILIAEQFNNRVIETDTEGNIIWSFGLGPNDFSAKSIIGVNDAQRVGRFTLMAGTGNRRA